jgi:hypothetical protein
VGGQRHDPGALSLEKRPAPAVQEARWASVPIWTNEKNLAATGIRIQDSLILSRK